MTKDIQIVLLTTIAFGLLAGCTPTVAKRGNLLEDYQVKQITPGVHTRTDALKILGSPTTQSPFDENIWYYIGQETEKTGILDPQVKKERIVAVTFNETGIIQTIGDIDAGRLAIPLERSKTTTHGNEVTIMQQFLGNIGKFNTSQDAQN